MIGMPAPGQKITMEQGARAIAELADMAHQYPVGQTWDQEVTLNDEQWLAVMVTVGAFITHHAIEGAPRPYPEWVDDRLREAVEIIWEANMKGVIMNSEVKNG